MPLKLTEVRLLIVQPMGLLQVPGILQLTHRRYFNRVKWRLRYLTQLLSSHVMTAMVQGSVDVMFALEEDGPDVTFVMEQGGCRTSATTIIYTTIITTGDMEVIMEVIIIIIMVQPIDHAPPVWDSDATGVSPVMGMARIDALLAREPQT